MFRNRRRFLKYMAAGTGTLAGLTSWWAAVSKQRSARILRMFAADARRSIAPAPAKPDPSKWSENQVTLAWLGHSTVLISFYGIRILTDPAFGSRVGVSLGLGTVGPKRHVSPALSLKELPPIDVVLLSHAHLDHMDLPTLSRLPRNTSTVTAKLTSDLLSSTSLRNVSELGWNEKFTFRNGSGDLTIEAVQVKHWGERWPNKLERGYNGYILQREDKRILFAGDTAHTPLFTDLRSKGPFAAAIMPIGAYRPWIWNHCDPEEAVAMANAARADYIVPVHHSTFRLSDEPMAEPMDRLEQALAHEPERIALKRIGETFICAA